MRREAFIPREAACFSNLSQTSRPLKTSFNESLRRLYCISSAVGTTPALFIREKYNPTSSGTTFTTFAGIEVVFNLSVTHSTMRCQVPSPSEFLAEESLNLYQLASRIASYRLHHSTKPNHPLSTASPSRTNATTADIGTGKTAFTGHTSYGSGRSPNLHDPQSANSSATMRRCSATLNTSFTVSFPESPYPHG